MLEAAAVPGGVKLQLGLDAVEQANFFFATGLGQHLDVGLGLGTQVHQERGIAAVVQNHVRAFGLAALAAELKNAVGVVPVINQVLALVGKHRCAGGHQRGGGVVLCREDVARGPAHLRTECLQGLDQHSGLYGHVQAASDARALEGLRLGKLFADRHQTGHFGLGNADLFAPPNSQRQVGNFIVLVFDRFQYSVHGSLQKLL